MIVVKIKDKKVDGIINLEFYKVIFINYQPECDTYELLALDGKGDSIMLCRSLSRVKIEVILKEMLKKIKNNQKLIEIKVNKDNYSSELEQGDEEDD